MEVDDLCGRLGPWPVLSRALDRGCDCREELGRPHGLSDPKCRVGDVKQPSPVVKNKRLLTHLSGANVRGTHIATPTLAIRQGGIRALIHIKCKWVNTFNSLIFSTNGKRALLIPEKRVRTGALASTRPHFPVTA